MYRILVALIVFASWSSNVCGADRPNVLLVTADNLGYGDLRCFNAESPIHTPHLDRFASEGARLTQFYTASPTCSVSRACLLTGRIPQRHRLLNQLPGLEGNYGVGLNPKEVLLPTVLHGAGYATACFGKWNIGFAPKSRPTERGFDEFFGHASGNMDYYTHVYNGRHDLYRGTEPAYDKGYSTDLFADAAIDFIRRKRSGPWFVYLPFNAPHFPNSRNKAPGESVVWQAPDAAFDSYEFGPETDDPKQRYGAVVTALDTAFGRVLTALKKLELAENTLVFFYSDNGAFMLKNRGLEVATNAPLRDGGVTCWEGGIRVAALARWPGRIPAGTVVDQPLWSPDLFPTFAALAHAPLPRGVVYDGVDILGALEGKTMLPERSFYFHYRRHEALRRGDWKIVRERPDDPWQLFNLTEDVGERKNLAAGHPEKLKALAEEFARREKDLGID